MGNALKISSDAQGTRKIAYCSLGYLTAYCLINVPAMAITHTGSCSLIKW